ncbi:MAG: hypothetical protein ACYDCD_02790 [Candidatus Acidiferrales bacterium]
MSRWFVLPAAALLIQFPLSSLGQTLQPMQSVGASDVNSVPTWLPVRIPAALYEKWRKYGIWDYKQQSSQYRDFTQFNFGATGNAAGLDKASLLALAQASKPTRDDVNRLDDPGLLANFDHNFDEFQELLRMARQDSHLIRIADDFTWLDSSSKWPRTDIGLSPKRWNEYRSLFEKLSLPEGIVRTADFPGAVFFIARVRGLCTGGSSAGFVYSTGALASTMESPSKALDAEARQNPKQHYAYVFKPLKPNWYAFYEIDW